MKELYGISGIAATTIALFASLPASAAPSQVTNVRLNPTQAGVDVVIETQAGDRPPQVFNVNRGNTWTAYVFNTQIRTPFQQSNPAPGISSVSVTPVAGNGVQVTVVGQGGTPTGQVSSRNAQGVILSVSSTGGPIAQATTPPPATVTPPGTPAAPTATPVSPPPVGVPVTPLTPNPSIPPSGTPAVPVSPVPPFQRRAVPPPVGDISVSQIDTSSASIDLGTAERIPRLVLRDAPVREVLSLLARAANLNLAFSEGTPGAAGAQGAARSGGPTISLDIENESVQDVFNYVLRIACVPAAGGAQGGAGGQCASLEANRSGRTIFVGPRLPNSARNLTARSLRLNQIPVTSAVNFLVGLGAESAVTRERQVRTVVAQSAAQLEGAQTGGGNQPQTQTETTTEARVEVQRANFQDSTPLLRGLQVSGDERTNSITLIGSPRQIELATSQLVQLDSRRRLVAVNVKVVDINLLALNRAGVSFSFGVGNSQFVNSNGVALLNFGTRTPGSTGLAGQPGLITSTPISGSPISFARAFFAQLQAAVTSGNAKILTDPTLVVQEGQTATVNLTQEVVTNFTQQITSVGTSGAQSTVTVEKKPAGLILPVKIDRIDDNGYVSLSVAPSISQPDGFADIVLTPGSSNRITLLSERKVESGQIRLRDGQTLVLSGIIQEQDRVDATKVPILGDIPLLGALFRSTTRTNQRREVVVLLTPQIIDDSDRSAYGYGYTPGADVRQFLQQQQQNGNR
ncbi:secretin N-terminal domain-containing protein [Phormidesmis priestleyi]